MDPHTDGQTGGEPLQTIGLSEIKIQNRLDTLPPPALVQTLRDSIAEHGLFMPIVISSDHVLVDGYARITAILALAKEEIAYSYRGNRIDPNQIPFVFESAIQERLSRRKELLATLRRGISNVADRAAAVAELHRNLRQDSLSWRAADTTQFLIGHGILKSSRQGTPLAAEPTVMRSLKIAQFARDPEVRSAATEDDAYKIVLRKTEELITEVLQGSASCDGSDSAKLV